MTVVIITIVIGHITMIVLMIIIAIIYLFVVPMKRAAEAAGKAEVLSLAQRLERVTAQCQPRNFHEHTREQKRQTEAAAAAGM